MDLHSFKKRGTHNISVVRTPLLVTTELLVDGSALLQPVGYNVKLVNFVFLRVLFNWIILFDWISKMNCYPQLADNKAPLARLCRCPNVLL